MSAEQDFAFLIQHRRKKTNIYIVDEDCDSPRIPKQSEQSACYTISDGNLMVIHDQYEAITQPEIYDALMIAIERDQGNAKQPCLVSDDRLSDYMAGQIDD